MSGDVQPRKRKEKRRKKDSEEIPTSYVSDEQLHVHKDASTGGNICAKILFFLLSFVLVVMIGLVLFEYRGVADDETLVPVSKWAATFDGWLEAPVKHDEHADITESGEQEHGESGEHESAEGEEHASEEAGSKEEDEEDEDEEKGSEEEETKSVEEEEEEEEEEDDDEDEEADKLEDEKSEEVDENEIDDQDEDEQEEEEEEEEESEEDVYGHGKSEEDLEAEKEDADDDAEEEEEEEEEEEDVEAGREELDDDDDDDDDDEERETSAYQRDSNEIDDLNEIPGITESDEDEEGDNLGGSDEIIDELPKIPGVDVKKIKAVSEEEDDVPRQKREKEVSETTKPVEGTSTIKDGKKPIEQPKSPDQSQEKLKTDQKGVTEKPIVPKHEKPEARHPREQPASKSKHRTQSTELPPTKDDGFPSGPGETGPSQKDDVTASKVTPPKKQKGGIGTIKDSPSEATLPKKQKDDTGPALKSEPLPADPSKPTVSRGKNLKEKDVSSDGAHSPPKASRIGDKIEHSSKVGKSGTVHKVIEQSSPTKLEENDRVSISNSPEVVKSTEEIKKTVEIKDKQGSKSLHTASASGVKNSEFDKQHAQKKTDDTVKKPDSKINAHGKVGSAGISASSDNKVKAASNVKEKENVRVEQPTRESGNSNSQTKQVKVNQSTDEKKLGEKKKEDRPYKQEKINNEQFTNKLDGQAESVAHVAAKDSRGAKAHEDPRKSKVDIEKVKASPPTNAKMSSDGSKEVPVKVSTDKTRKGSADNKKNRPPEKSADLKVANEKSANDKPPSGDTHHSRPKDTKESAVSDASLKHSVRKGDTSKTQEAKPSVQSTSSPKNSRDEVVRPTPTSEKSAVHQENSVNKKPVNSNIKKPSQDQKVTSKRTENEVTQPESERSSGRKAVPSQRDTDSETVK